MFNWIIATLRLIFTLKKYLFSFSPVVFNLNKAPFYFPTDGEKGVKFKVYKNQSLCFSNMIKNYLFFEVLFLEPKAYFIILEHNFLISEINFFIYSHSISITSENFLQSPLLNRCKIRLAQNLNWMKQM